MDEIMEANVFIRKDDLLKGEDVSEEEIEEMIDAHIL